MVIKQKMLALSLSLSFIQTNRMTCFHETSKHAYCYVERDILMVDT